jgi:pimeloyl-ACP methyl ester carboxylesterase
MLVHSVSMNQASHSRFFDLPTGRLHFRDCGEGPAIALLHANPGDSRDFDAIVPALSQTHRVLAIDWPGYGLSEMPAKPCDVDALFFHQVLKHWVDALDLPPLCLIGNSLGGNAAARLAVTDPHRVAGLVLVSPGGFTPHNFLTRAFCRFQGSRWAMSPARWASTYLKCRTDVAWAMIHRARHEQSTPAHLVLNRALWRSFAGDGQDLREIAGRIDKPSLLIFGLRDPAIPAHRDGRIAAACMTERAQTRLLDCGHAAFAEMPQAFLNELLPFLAQLWRREAMHQSAWIPERTRLR